MCTTTTHWATHISEACSRGGSAICDGICLTHGDECSCWCHTSVQPDTVDGMRSVHDEFWDVVARFEHTNLVTLQRLLTEERNRLQLLNGDRWKGVQGAQFRTAASSNGTGYVYVVWS